MNRMINRPVAVLVVVGIFGIAASGVMCLVGARVNTSKSIPIGLYWTSSAPVTKGKYVIFCPPQRRVFDNARKRGYIGPGFCPGGYGYMMKKILAAKGDTVSVTPQGVAVNGKLLPYSKPLLVDGVGRSMPRMSDERYTLGESELLLMTDRSSTSFDARYYGIISREQVKSVIRPVLTW